MIKNINSLVRKNILELTPYSSARSLNLYGILLDANENPYCNMDVTERGININRYPDPSHTKMRKQLSKYLSINSENIVFGSGSDELIDLIIRIFCEPGKDNIIIPKPTYGMYEVSAKINNVEVKYFDLTEEFQIAEYNFNNEIDENSKILFLCSPNNPTGDLLNKDSVTNIIKSFNGIVVIDEAYIDFCNIENSFFNEINSCNNIIILRTFSKAWGMAGLRLGYAIASKEIIDFILNVKLPYNIGAVVTDLFFKVMNKEDVKRKNINSIISERDRLYKELIEIKEIKKVYHSDANYILFQPDNHIELFSYLIENGVVIRDRSSQIKNSLRVSVGTLEENNMFLTKLRKFYEIKD
ncbi:MAG: histidinol-phosphate transaminase [Melioribacteraceae bacterium]|nr:histidinol-phosphate transaminase [Melioribacteraceae bacterium]